MKIISFKLISLLLTLIITLSLTSTLAVLAKNDKKTYAESMLLVFELRDNQVSLQKATKLNKPFNLKNASKISRKLEDFNLGKIFMGSGKLKYNILTEQNEVLYADLVSVSLGKYYDYEDENGQMKGGFTKEESIYFSVLAPYTDQVKSIEFYQPLPIDQSLAGQIINSVDLTALHSQQQAFSAASSPYVVTKILDNGSSDQKIDIVLMGDGYTASEISTTYYNGVNEFVEIFLATDPFGPYQDLFNIWRIDVISNESKVDHPCQGIWKDTVLNASYGDCSMPRYLTADDNAVFNTAATIIDAGGDYDLIAVMVNDVEWGGTGGSYITYPAEFKQGGIRRPDKAVQIAMHEFGHVLGDLADEYSDPNFSPWIYPYGCLGTTTTTNDTYIGGKDSPNGDNCQVFIDQFPNITAYNKIELLAEYPYKWSYWIDQEGIYDPSEFRGGLYVDHGLYRPSDTSKMRSSIEDFDAVSREQLIKQMFNSFQSSLITSYEPETGTTYDIYTQFSVTTPNIDSLGIMWLIDDQLIPNKTDSTFDFVGVSVSEGLHTLTVLVSDNSDWIQDPSKIQQQISWQVNIGDLPDTVAPTINGPFIGFYKPVDEQTFMSPSDLEIWWSFSDDPFGDGVNTSTIQIKYKSVSDAEFTQLGVELHNNNTAASATFPVSSLADNDYILHISVKDNANNLAEDLATIYLRIHDVEAPFLSAVYYRDFKTLEGATLSKNSQIIWMPFDDRTDYQDIIPIVNLRDSSDNTYQLPTYSTTVYFAPVQATKIYINNFASGDYDLEITLYDNTGNNQTYITPIQISNASPEILEIKSKINNQEQTLEDGQEFSLPTDRITWTSADPDADSESGPWYAQSLGVVRKAYRYNKNQNGWSAEIELTHKNDGTDPAGKYGRWSWLSPKVSLIPGAYQIELIAEDGFNKTTIVYNIVVN